MWQISSGLIVFYLQLPSQSALRAASSPTGRARDYFVDKLTSPARGEVLGGATSEMHIYFSSLCVVILTVKI